MDNYTDLIERFTEEEKERLVQHRPPGAPTREDQELFLRRDRAVEELFRRLSAGRPQTKRHCYYVAKALGLCGIDTDRSATSKSKTYFSDVIADIINKACWESRIDWENVLDETRTLNRPLFWENAATFLADRLNIFDIDRAKGQRTRIIVCTEKDAVIESVFDICDKEHIPTMSFHGQSSDPAVYKLAKLIHEWKGECDHVRIAYLGDFDPCGLTINQVVFGDPLEVFVEKKQKGEKPSFGKLFDLQMGTFPDSPHFFSTRIGITEEDLDNPDYQQYISYATNTKDTNFKNFRTVRDGDLRTLGIDILSTEEIEARLQAFIDQFKDQTAWEEREQFFLAERSKLKQMITSALGQKEV